METPTPVAQTEPKSFGMWIVAALVIIGIVIALTSINNKSTDEVETSSEDEMTTEEMATSSDVDVKTTSVTKLDADSALPYTSAFTKYAGRRIEFNSRCTMTPSSVSFKKGTKVMLDNRGSAVNTIVVGDQLYRIQGYNFSFITLSAESLPSTLVVSCGGNTRAGTVTVTK
jgi:hypothetical protein